MEELNIAIFDSVEEFSKARSYKRFDKDIIVYRCNNGKYCIVKSRHVIRPSGVITFGTLLKIVWRSFLIKKGI